MSQAQFDALMAKIDGKTAKPKEEDPDLIAKVKKEKEEKDKTSVDAKSLESAIRFSVQGKEWFKENASILPKEIEGVFAAAEKESYDSPIAKDAAIKSGIIQSFFHIQENLDFLTSVHKSTIESWMKMTNTGRESKAQELFDAIFEPTLLMVKRIKKAELLNKSGGERSSDSVEEAYKQRLIKQGQSHYMGVKH
jgi:hypothetical protein